MKKAEDFERAVKIYDLHYFPLRTCSICEYLIGYLFSQGNVFFDSGCDCIFPNVNLSSSSYQSLADLYNMNIGNETQNEMDEFFKF